MWNDADHLIVELTAALKRERARAAHEIAVLRRFELDSAIAQADESGACGGINDVASDLAEQELDQTLKGRVCQRLVDVEAALLRIADGTFGRCYLCGRRIPEGRLQALPWAAYCKACAASLEASQPLPVQAGLVAHIH